MLSKNTEYLVAGALALYVVFLTRPAPQLVTNILASPVAQVAGLAGVIYLGATQSVVVAILAALALVVSIPSREHMENKDDKKEKKEDKPAKPSVTPKLMQKKSTIKRASENVSAPAKPVESAEEPEPAGQKLKTAGTKEAFTVGDLQAADF